MSPRNETLALRIAETLKASCTHTTLPRVAADAGIGLGAEAEGQSKRDRVLAGLAGLDRGALAACAQRLGARLGDFDLEEMGFAVLEEDERPITEITRRDIARCFGHEFGGERPVQDLVGKLWPLEAMDTSVFPFRSLRENIIQHMVRNAEDWSAEDLFDKIGALRCSRTRFSRLLETALHPLARRGPDQERLAGEINILLQRDGYRLEKADETSGHPVYIVTNIRRSVAGSPKNLIFASIGRKPELGFSDAVNNDIVLLSGSDKCLIYDRPIRRDGVLWSELVAWWQEIAGSDEANAAIGLGKRLRASLGSEAEKSLFRNYFKRFDPKLQRRFPALIPQVYLHYDPVYIRELRGRLTFPRQRMDFLLLLAGGVRVVIEVDGKHHFSDNDRPSLEAYARMVGADRDLKLAGYEIYRFGANELVGPRAPGLIKTFFDRLFVLYKPL